MIGVVNAKIVSSAEGRSHGRQETPREELADTGLPTAAHKIKGQSAMPLEFNVALCLYWENAGEPGMANSASLVSIPILALQSPNKE